MSLTLASEVVDAYITRDGEMRIGKPKGGNGVLSLSHAGKPFKKTLRLCQNGSKLTFLVKIPELEILDPCGVTKKLLESSSYNIKGFRRILDHLNDSDRIEFMTKFFEQVHKWNETPCEKLADSIWVVSEYSWHYGNGSSVKIVVNVEPVVSRDRVNCVKYVLLQMSGFQPKSEAPLKNGSSSVEKSVVSNIEEVLTKREMEVLDLIVKGYTSKVIADKLFISEHTVKNHRKNMMRKVDVSNVIQLLSKTALLV